MKAPTRNKFDRKGVYACGICGKRTRNIDGESSTGMCKACYEMLEQENEKADKRVEDKETEMLWCQMCGRYQPAGDEPKMGNVCHHCGATILRAPKTDQPLWGYVEEGEKAG